VWVSSLHGCLFGVWIGLCAAPAVASDAANPADPRRSGNHFLSPQLQALQADLARSPITLWVEQGHSRWQAQCSGCHGEMASLKTAVASFPKLAPDGTTLLNLEDQIAVCSHRKQPINTASRPIAVSASASAATALTPESEPLLALSAALRRAAKGEPLQARAVQPYFERGEKLYTTRMGRINLACAHCHDDKVGASMRNEVISQAQPTGFPIFRQSWQTLGSIERRLRACYSGVQAPVPELGSAQLRDLELFLTVRAKGMPLDGPSVRR
jgi:L-cysteine S-thiosulfotransferase